MTIKLEIPAHQFRAARNCAATKDIRWYLNGVLVRVHRDGRVMLAGTDGYIAFAGAANAHVMNPPTDSTLDIIVPIDVAKKVTKRQEMVHLDQQAGGNWLLDNTILFTAIDGKFPDLARVIPDTTSGVPATFNPSLYERASDALVEWSKLGKSRPGVRYNGNGVAVMAATDRSACALIMPLRTEDSEFSGAVPFDRSILSA